MCAAPGARFVRINDPHAVRYHGQPFVGHAELARDRLGFELGKCDDVARIAIIGTGSVGLGAAIYFAPRGYAVVASTHTRISSLLYAPEKRRSTSRLWIAAVAGSRILHLARSQRV